MWVLVFAHRQGAHAGRWETKWPLVAPQETPWTHKAAAHSGARVEARTGAGAESYAGGDPPPVPLRDILPLSDLPEQKVPNALDLQSTFFRMPLLRAWIGCRKASQLRTHSLVERTIAAQRNSQAMSPKQYHDAVTHEAVGSDHPQRLGRETIADIRRRIGAGTGGLDSATSAAAADGDGSPGSVTGRGAVRLPVSAASVDTGGAGAEECGEED